MTALAVSVRRSSGSLILRVYDCSLEVFLVVWQGAAAPCEKKNSLCVEYGGRFYTEEIIAEEPVVPTAPSDHSVAPLLGCVFLFTRVPTRSSLRQAPSLGSPAFRRKALACLRGESPRACRGCGSSFEIYRKDGDMGAAATRPP